MSASMITSGRRLHRERLCFGKNPVRFLMGTLILILAFILIPDALARKQADRGLVAL